MTVRPAPDISPAPIASVRARLMSALTFVLAVPLVLAAVAVVGWAWRLL